MTAILNFRIFFAKIAKHQNACISKTVPDRANLAKFLTHRVSMKTSLSKFQRIFHSPKMVAILNFRIFCKNAKLKNACISKTMLDRAISMKYLTHRVTLLSSWPNFQKNYVPSIMAAFLNFRIFKKKLQNTKKASSISKTLSCHYFSFSGHFVFAMQKQLLCVANDPLVFCFFSVVRYHILRKVF